MEDLQICKRFCLDTIIRKGFLLLTIKKPFHSSPPLEVLNPLETPPIFRGGLQKWAPSPGDLCPRVGQFGGSFSKNARNLYSLSAGPGCNK